MIRVAAAVLVAVWSSVETCSGLADENLSVPWVSNRHPLREGCTSRCTSPQACRGTSMGGWNARNEAGPRPTSRTLAAVRLCPSPY
eukprot:CAMPEP_0182853426 /NCGR_PEP_ID=MMETSP0034_2-20130328/696_1 /TAXON_ID=156128 /ORGANISM="Nephroselmis pyriformis, Strain CCMP717" /LENGTH=85 /DNA_ID=CAMNT_0024984197 /DNA_START=359 /DNA_END=613 /DNA_ORIENTATION=+